MVVIKVLNFVLKISDGFISKVISSELNKKHFVEKSLD